MKNFEDFGLSPALGESLARMQYTTPTPIQAQAIPPALKGRDIMGSAQTGTGKTAAYAIPMIEHLMHNERSTALILTPTRELGKQVMEVIKQMLGYKSSIKTAFIIGGEPMRKQYQQLDKRPRLIVGTPGRINDHLERGSIDLGLTDFLILDETDRMLDMGFSVQLDRIFKYLPEKRQTLMFSATLPDDIMRMSKQYLTNPERVAVGSTIAPAQNIVQEIIKIDEHAKYEELLRQLDERKGSIIMFVKTKFGTERMAKRLKAAGHDANAIHGDLKQSRRERVIRQFRGEEFRILVATDVVARGLDIPHIKHVVNYDLPQVPEDYIHRVGRTARAGDTGEALSFITSKEGRKWHAIEMLMNPDMKSDSGRSYGKKSGGKRSPNRKERGFAGRPGKNSGRRPNQKRSDARNDNRSDNRSEGQSVGDRPERKFNKPKAEGQRKEYSSRSRARAEGRPEGGRNDNRSEDQSSGRWSDQMTTNPNDKRTDRRDKRSDDFAQPRFGEKKEGMGKARRKGPNGKGFNSSGKAFNKPSHKSKDKFAKRKDKMDNRSGNRSEDNYSEKSFVKPLGKKTFGDKKKSFSKDGARSGAGKKPFGKKFSGNGKPSGGKKSFGSDGSRPMTRGGAGKSSGKPNHRSGGQRSKHAA